MMNPTVDRLVARTAARKAALAAKGLQLKAPRPRGNQKPGREPPQKFPQRPPCAKLGLPTGRTRPCQGCGGAVQQVPLRACAEFGQCTTSKVVKLEGGTPVACCAAMCKGYVAPAASRAPQS